MNKLLMTSKTREEAKTAEELHIPRGERSFRRPRPIASLGAGFLCCCFLGTA